MTRLTPRGPVRRDRRDRRHHLRQRHDGSPGALEAANILLSRVARFSALKRRSMEVAQRRGLNRARVALARKIGVILHRMWTDGTDFRWTKANVTSRSAEEGSRIRSA